MYFNFFFYEKRHWHRQAQISDWFRPSDIQLQSVLHESSRFRFYWNQDNQIHEEGASRPIFGRCFVLNVRFAPWSILLSRNVLFPVSDASFYVHKFSNFNTIPTILIATTVDHAGNGNIHRIHHSTTTNHWHVTQNRNSWLDWDHRIHHLLLITQMPHQTTTAKWFHPLI